MPRKNPSRLSRIFYLPLIILIATSCSSLPDRKRESPLKPHMPPAQWQNNEASNPVINAIIEGWLNQLNDSQLNETVHNALKTNIQLAEKIAEVDIARQDLVISGAPRLPQLDAKFNASRTLVSNNDQQPRSNVGLSLDLSWEIDVWGKLKDAQKQASLNLAAKETDLIAFQQNLVADIALAWYDMIESQQLLDLFQQRLTNLQTNLEIIESGYQQGLNQALDVYLARTDVEQQLARVLEQTQSQTAIARRIQLLLGQYPSGQWTVKQTLPELTQSIPAGVPSELLTRRPDLTSAWLNLLSSDLGVAIAHKQRFPRLSLTSNLGYTTNDFNNILDANHLVWSLIGNLVQPIFNNDALAAQEQKAKLNAIKLEKSYLRLAYDAFSQVENALTQDTSLNKQYMHYRKAQEHGVTAETLSFKQYQRGLVNYTTVLESQRRSVDVQTKLIQIKKERLKNRVKLFLALGGGF